MVAALLCLLENSLMQVGECREGAMAEAPSAQGAKCAAATSCPTRMIRSETPLGWSRVRVVSVHCQALRSLGFTRACLTGPCLGVAVGYDAGRVQKVCSPVARSLRLLLIFLLVVQHMFL